MGVNIGPSLPIRVRNKMILCLDAGDRISYIGSGATWSDLTIFNHDATIQNSTDWSADEANGRFDFNGSNHYCTIARTDTFDAATSVSLACWFTTDDAAGEGNLISKEYQYRLMASHGSSNPGFQLQYGSSDYSGIYVGHALSTSRWYHMAGTYDNTSGVQNLYLDGNLVATATPSTNGTYDNNENIGIGAKPGGSHFHEGKIATVAIWNTPLTTRHINLIFNSQRSRFGV